ncbi:MAG: S-methyl-5'-thioadenosine phosphorylase [Thermoanaerobaculia bacterium]
MSQASIGVLGGSGLYDMAELESVAEVEIDTPFGAPSGPYVLGDLEGRTVAFLARHGRGHRLMPSEINNRANVWGFKSLGVEYLVSVSAVGSMKLDYRPTDIVVPDQLIDRTHGRRSTFFGDGLVAHVSMARPMSESLRLVLLECARAAGARVHDGGVYLCMEGPQFSSRAESELYRSWGVDVIGMTNAPEAKLAREAEICYATLAMVTDYDCWHDDEGEVSVDAVLEALRENAEMARDVVRRAVRSLPPPGGPDCSDALATALITDPAAVPAATLERLDLLIRKYYPREDA